MPSANVVKMVGTMGQDPEIRFTPSGEASASYSIMTDTKHPEWHKVTSRGQLAEFAQKYLRKGKTVYVEGQLQTRKYQGQDGKDHYITEIVASSVQIVK